MKLDPVFTVKSNKLYKISDDSFVEPSNLTKISFNWSTVELADEQYNEEFLAQAREEYKSKYDDRGLFIILAPVIDRPLTNPEQIELFINACNHTARRLKDCVCIAGFEFPEEFLKSGSQAVIDFMDALSKKHAQYAYFASKKSAEAANLLEDAALSAVVLY